MAANEVVGKNGNKQPTHDESIVNRWIVDYYLFLAIELFKNEQYSDFCGVRDILERVLSRPLESTDLMPTKIRVLQFLSRINDGDKLDWSFESDESVTPLESAMRVLENMSEECSIPQQDLEKVSTSIKDMLVVICIKSKEFEKAKEVLNKYFPKAMVGKKAIFMGLINQRSSTHEVLEQINFHQFREQMVQFCESLCPSTVPFLHKAATQLIDKRLLEKENSARPEPDEQNNPGVSSGVENNAMQPVSCPYSNNKTFIQRARLEAAYIALASDSHARTLAQLEDEVEREEQSATRQDDLFLHLSASPFHGSEMDERHDEPSQRNSSSPMEASPADQAPVIDGIPQTETGHLSEAASLVRGVRQYTVAQLVVEPDSQTGSQCSQELEAEVTAEEPAQLLLTSSQEDLQSSVTKKSGTKSTQQHQTQESKRHRHDSAESIQPSDTQEDPFSSDASSEIPVRKLRKRITNPLNKSPETIQLPSDSEDDPLESVDTCRTPVQNTQRLNVSCCISDSPNRDLFLVRDAKLDSPSLVPVVRLLKNCSTPCKDSAPDEGPSYSKWKRLYNDAKETKDTWSDEESFFNSKKKKDSNKVAGNVSSISESGRRKWSAEESQMLKEAVAKFGEGNWSKIRAYYSFKDRTNVNLKDRWRTMKRQQLV
ncbi:telomeric repeat binding factor a isoform X2 [Myripristis murdjan]|uniref:telomeric repeat binding factor a isoform X2 n=1 Tax=Myripristis murdjan TaxID=586833 RepID=UPI001175E393|nr:telomeric repeat-binding factor 2 isoform X2 [Myripristis murdjan]